LACRGNLKEKNTMPLFRIQDTDRPAFVLATDFHEAIEKWQAAVAAENDGEIFIPQGVEILAPDTELIIAGGFLPSDEVHHFLSGDCL
jgi:hypothetical protein